VLSAINLIVIELTLLRPSHINEYLEEAFPEVQEQVEDVASHDIFHHQPDPRDRMRKSLMRSAELNLTLPDAVVELTYLVNNNGTPVGLAIVKDVAENENFSINVLINKASRRQGFGLAALNQLKKELQAKFKFDQLQASLSEDNLAGQRLLQAAGFVLIESDQDSENDSDLITYTF
jgi:RimJ/RimL family protein N-acetyltransferase